METKTGYIQAGNAKLYYEIAGAGQPLVFIHAGVADQRQWNREFTALAREFRVLRYDMRNFGKSKPAAGEFSSLNDLTAVLDHLQLEQPLVLIGCSMGGGLAIDFALEYPSRVKALVAVGSGPSGLQLDLPDHPLEAAVEKAYADGDLDRAAELETIIWFDGMGRTTQEVDQEMRKLALEMNRLAISHDAKNLGTRLPNTATPAVERLDELQLPLLMVVGENDIPYIHAAADYIIDRVPTARKVVLANAAHLTNMEQPDKFLSTVRSFLKELL
jgi:pimeloyl-ACP methyl ester carboxylesterase